VPDVQTGSGSNVVITSGSMPPPYSADRLSVAKRASLFLSWPLLAGRIARAIGSLGRYLRCPFVSFGRCQLTAEGFGQNGLRAALDSA
jgi:hypothetical protein